MFNAPWPALALTALIVLSYLVQIQLPDPEALEARYGLVPSQLAAGDLVGLVTYMGLHSGWPDLLSDAFFIFIAATPLARLLGETAPRALSLIAFYVACGVIAGALFAGLFEFARQGSVPFYHPVREVFLIGGSGAVSGLLGAASRTIGTGRRLGPVLGKTTLTLAVLFTLGNLAVGLSSSGSGVLVAWQVPIFGFFAGLFLIGPWVALFGQRPPVALTDGWPVPLNEL
jgi:membrane associated rhomboid family serine protease